MSKFKKVLLMCTAYVLVAVLAIGGTLAYLTSTDDEVNVMTLGNVSIAQHEYERVVDADGNYTTIDVDGTISYELKEFTQGKPLYPMVGDPNDGYDSTTVRLGQLGHNSRGGMDVLPDANVQDKFVVVENTGKNDAYVRTLVAFEAGSVAEEDWYKLVKYTSHFTWKETQDWFVVEIQGNNYYVVEFVYNGYEDVQHPNGVLTPGDYTYNNLAQVYMFSHATNEDVEALDGNDNGKFDILVLSQAIQVAGFENAKSALDTGFGAFNEENVAKWFDGVAIPEFVGTTEELDAALANGGNISLINDVALGGKVKADTAIALAGNTITGEGTTVNAGLSMEGGTYVMNHSFDYIDLRPTADAEYIYKNMTFINNYKTKPGNNGTDYIESVAKLVPTEAGIKTTIVFENCVFQNARFEANGLSGKKSEIDITFKNCTFNMLGHENAIHIGNYFTGVVNIEDCTFNYQGTAGNKSALSVSNSSDTTVTVTATNNKLNAEKAVAYTYDPAKGETIVDSIAIDYYGAKNYCFFDYRYLNGKYSTVNETGTVISGEIAIESRR